MTHLPSTADRVERRSTRSRRRRPRGLTLLEVMVGLVIVVGLVGISIPVFSRVTKARLRSETNKVAAAIRHTYNRSAALGLYMRMVIDIDGNTWWVEASDQPNFLSREKLEQGEDPTARAAEEAKEAEEDGRPQHFKRRVQFQEDGLIPRTSLPQGVKIAGVYTTGQEDTFTQGKAFIHFFPNGFVEPALVYTSDADEEDYFTLEVHPLTGKVSRQKGKIDPDRRFGEPDKVEEESR